MSQVLEAVRAWVAWHIGLLCNANTATAALHHSQKPGMLESMTALRTVKGMSALPAWAASDSSSERPLEDVSSASSVESCR